MRRGFSLQKKWCETNSMVLLVTDLCHVSVVSLSPLLEMNCALEWSLCAGSGLKLWLSSSESGGHWWAGWGAASPGRSANRGGWGTVSQKHGGLLSFMSYVVKFSWIEGDSSRQDSYVSVIIHCSQRDGTVCDLCNLNSLKIQLATINLFHPTHIRCKWQKPHVHSKRGLIMEKHTVDLSMLTLA